MKNNLPGTEATTGGLRLARSMDTIKPSVLREVLARASRPGVISFGLGMPATDLFPTEALSRASAQVFAEGPAALQYGVPSAGLKTHIVRLMKERGVLCTEEQIFLTSGSQQGMRLAAQTLLDPGGRVMVEEIVYEGFLMAVRGYGPQLSIVPTTSETGIDLDAVEERLAAGERPAFLYTIPDAHNPLGSTLNAESRQRLVNLARRYRMPILEDDAYGLLYHEDNPQPPLRSLDEHWVLYLGSFSKILAPGLRLGWMVVPPELMVKLSAVKHASDLDTANLNQNVLCRFFEQEDFSTYLERLRGEYRTRRNATLDALARYLPTSVKWTVPLGGMYIWVELPEGFDALEILAQAIETDQVAFSPGVAFAAGENDWARRCFRLSFANNSPEKLEEGVRRLGRTLGRVMG